MKHNNHTTKTIRNKGRVTTIETVETALGERSTTWSLTDNLDTKSLNETQSNYEETFVRIRDLLEGKPWCCDNREDTLTICQAVVDELRSNLLIRKDEND